MTDPAAHEARLRAAALQEQIGATVQALAPEAVIVDTAALERLVADLAASRAQLEQVRNRAVEGRCPNGCGETLFLAAGGYVTCSWIDCPNPGAASDRLAAVPDPEAVSRG